MHKIAEGPLVAGAPRQLGDAPTEARGRDDSGRIDDLAAANHRRHGDRGHLVGHSMPRAPQKRDDQTNENRFHLPTQPARIIAHLSTRINHSAFQTREHG